MRWAVVLLAVVVAAIAVLGYFTLTDTGGSVEPIPAPDAGGRPAGSDAKPTPQGPVELQALSPHPETVQQEFERAFSAWHARKHGRSVEIVWGDVGGGTSTIMRYITANFRKSPDGIGLDIFWGGGFVPYQKLAEDGLLDVCEVPDSILRSMAPDVAGVPTRDAQFRWYGSALSGFGIIFNKPRLARKGIPEPKTWTDLAAPQMLGEVGAADPRKSGSAYMAYEIVLQALGWEKGWSVLTRMAANARKFYQGASDIPKDISLGEVSAGPAIDFYAWAQVREDGPEKIGYILPQSMTVINPDAIAVLKGAPAREVARRLVEFVLSVEGQRLWYLKKGAPGGPVNDELGRIPVRMDVVEKHKAMSNVRFSPSQLKSDFRFSPDTYAARRKALKDLYGAVLIDAHPELVAAWKAVVKRGAKPDEVRTLCRPPLTNASLSAMSVEKWGDSAYRNRMIAKWSNEARRRYMALAHGRAR